MLNQWPPRYSIELSEHVAAIDWQAREQLHYHRFEARVGKEDQFESRVELLVVRAEQHHGWDARLYIDGVQLHISEELSLPDAKCAAYAAMLRAFLLRRP